VTLARLHIRPLRDWRAKDMAGWSGLIERTAASGANAGRNEAFEAASRSIRSAVRSKRPEGVRQILATRAGARALTTLWLEDSQVRRALLRQPWLEALIETQQPRLTRLSLLNLLSLYFQYFDELDSAEEPDLRATVESILLSQLSLFSPGGAVEGRPDPIATLTAEGLWLLDIEGPLELAKRTRSTRAELGETLSRMGLAGMDAGRYGAACRAHFYLERLKAIPVGGWDDVLDELLKPVAKAPYRGQVRIGHAALAIMIDRSTENPGSDWIRFFLKLAGDPRISSQAQDFVEWWRPLGAQRIEKVRSWLSREDLRLFLRAVEQYGEESQNADLQRMFPARKRFLEGLFDLGLVRISRLMLGLAAQRGVQRVLNRGLSTSFARLSPELNRQAVIYLDCGEFCLVEGSHSFRIWVYLEPPSQLLTDFEHDTFTRDDLIRVVPHDYETRFPEYEYGSVVHNGTWQWTVIAFLAEQGISLDVQKLLSQQDYVAFRTNYGLPVPTREGKQAREVRLRRRSRETRHVGAPNILEGEIDAAPPAAMVAGPARPAAALSSPAPRAGESSIRVDPAETPTITNQPESEETSTAHSFRGLHQIDWRILAYLHRSPPVRARDLARVFNLETNKINPILYGRLLKYVRKDDAHRWTVTNAVARALDEMEQQE
jgi:hypothetical protein